MKNATADNGRETFSPSIEALETFVMAVDHPGLSLRKLATRLGCSSHTQVKARLDSLEDGYGVSFGIHGKGQDFIPTPEGEKLCRYAKQVLTAHRKLRRWPPDEREVIRLGVSPDVMRLLFAPVLKAFLSRAEKRNVNVILRERDPASLLRLLRARRIDVALRGVLVDEQETPEIKAPSRGLRMRLVGKPYPLVAVGRTDVFRGRAGKLDSLDALAAEVETLCIQRAEYRDLERIGKLPQAKRWVLTDTQAGSVTLAEAGLGAGLVWEVPGLHERLGLVTRPFRKSLLPKTQLAVWSNTEDEATRRESLKKGEGEKGQREWDPVLTFLDALPASID